MVYVRIDWRDFSQYEGYCAPIEWNLYMNLIMNLIRRGVRSVVEV